MSRIHIRLPRPANDKNRAALRRVLRSLRATHDLSQAQFANKLRAKRLIMNQTRYCNIETGLIEASEAERVTIERFFRVPPDHIPWITVTPVVIAEEPTEAEA